MQQQRARPSGESAYETWSKGEGIPIHSAMGGVDDVTALPRRPWARTGGTGTFIELLGTTQAERSVYIAEIPGGGALNPERHLFDEAIYILKGRGLTEVWQEGGVKVTFEWGEASVFALPLNAWHRLVNGSREPALFLAITTAPQVMNALFETEFVFNCEHQFPELFGGDPDYFAPGEEKQQYSKGSTVWYTNFIPDARAEFLDPHEQKVSGGNQNGYRMARHFPSGHISEWPAGRYHKAHYHAGGAIVMGLRGKGYVPVWSNEFGMHPYQDGHEEQVVTINWGPRSIYCPPDGWFHQHMNTGKEPARHIACYPNRSAIRRRADGLTDTTTSIREGGALIDYEDEDPEIRRRFEEALSKEGVECKMPPVVYRH